MPHVRKVFSLRSPSKRPERKGASAHSTLSFLVDQAGRCEAIVRLVQIDGQRQLASAFPGSRCLGRALREMQHTIDVDNEIETWRAAIVVERH